MEPFYLLVEFDGKTNSFPCQLFLQGERKVFKVHVWGTELLFEQSEASGFKLTADARHALVISTIDSRLLNAISDQLSIEEKARII